MLIDVHAGGNVFTLGAPCCFVSQLTIALLTVGSIDSALNVCTNRCDTSSGNPYTASLGYYKEFDFATLALNGRRSSNASSMSADSMRKMSNDSGISTMSSRAGRDSPSLLTAHADDLIGEPRLSTMQSLLAQQSLSAAASLNSSLLGLPANTFLPSSGLSGLWSNPLTAAALIQQQQEATRKVLESANGKLRGFFFYPIS